VLVFDGDCLINNITQIGIVVNSQVSIFIINIDCFLNIRVGN